MKYPKKLPSPEAAERYYCEEQTANENVNTPMEIDVPQDVAFPNQDVANPITTNKLILLLPE